jgi:hypothetical protein
MSWSALLLLAAGAYAFKLIGMLVGDRLATRFSVVAGLLPAALFAAIIVLMTFAEGGRLVFDARLVGVAAGAVALWRRAPFVLVVLVAMASTAAWRAVT